MSRELGISKPAVIITIIVVVLIIIGGGFFLKTRIDKLTSEPVPTPVAEVPIETEQPTPEPTPEFDRSKYTLRVLNGTKTSGLAASVSSKLKDLGYEVGKTGNATSSAIEQTTIRVKEGADAGFMDQLIQDLSADYKAVAGVVLKSSDDVDAEIVIGAQ